MAATATGEEDQGLELAKVKKEIAILKKKLEETE